MILIADSGSTKTDWVLVDGENQIFFSTEGINPLFIDKTKVENQIKDKFPEVYLLSDVKEIFLYAPGCSIKERANLVKEPLSYLFKNAKIEVNSDLLGAARSLFMQNRGIVCILGTGSSSAYYNGETIEQKTNSLGYILGDEASGANLGLEFLKLYLHNSLDKETHDLFYSIFKLSTKDIINKVYREAYPNRFLASFSPFILQNIHIENIHNLVKQSFSTFIEKHILAYQESAEMPISFVGSIAYYFKDILLKLGEQYNINIDRISQKPILDLLDYHKYKEGFNKT